LNSNHLKQLKLENTDSILTDIENVETEASFLQRLFANLIDLVIEACVFVAIYVFVPREIILRTIGINPFTRYLFIFLLIVVYRLICIAIFQKTIGMILCRLKYLNYDLEPLTIKQKIIVVFVTKTSSIKYYKAN
jgi:uncharacterized RDD family membrane protein YckC